jgi:hypothetical protein
MEAATRRLSPEELHLKNRLSLCTKFADTVKWKTYSELSEDDRRELASCDMLLENPEGK